MDNSNAIGFFDSGLGGLSVWQEVNQLLPMENTIYLADSINAPYGMKSKEEIIELSIKNTEFLLERNCKMIVVACNTATTKAIKYLRKNYDIPFVGIEPAIKSAAMTTKTKSVGVLATEGTLVSELFVETSQKFASDIVTISQKGNGLVQLIEDGHINSPETEELLREYLEPMLTKNIDYLVLGCTHYPFLKPILNKILPEGVITVDSGKAIAKRVSFILNKYEIKQDSLEPKNRFYTNRSADIMQTFMEEFGMMHKAEFLDF